MSASTTLVDNRIRTIFKILGRIRLGIFLFPWLAACTAPTEAPQPEEFKVEVTGEAQGTTYSVTYYDLHRRDLKPAIDSLLGAIDASISTYKPASVISAWNQSDSGGAIDALFFDVLKVSAAAYRASDGAFNPCVMPLVRYWGFGPEQGSFVEPDAEQIDSLLSLLHFDSLRLVVGHRSFSLAQLTDTVSYATGFRLMKPARPWQLDFNAVGQGWSTDKVATLLEQRGIKIYMVDIGGEVVCGNPKPDGSPWRLGIESPSSNANDRSIFTTINLRNRAVATSGNYRKFLEKDGKRYSHTINPATGMPAQHSLLSASVVSATAAESDAMATAFMVMGADSTREFLQKKDYLGYYAYLIFDSAGHYVTWSSPALKAIIAEAE